MIFDAIVLSGGRSRRLDGRAKTTELVGGVPVLARVTAALAEARSVIVVGDPAGAGRWDVLTREEPSGGGPVAALAAGIAHVDADVVLTAAGDLPFLTADAVALLVGAAVGRADVALAVDDDGRDQLLLAAWRTDALRISLAALDSAQNAPIRALFDGRPVYRVALGLHPPPWWDCDTPGQLAQARLWAQEDTE